MIRENSSNYYTISRHRIPTLETLLQNKRDNFKKDCCKNTEGLGITQATAFKVESKNYLKLLHIYSGAVLNTVNMSQKVPRNANPH